MRVPEEGEDLEDGEIEDDDEEPQMELLPVPQNQENVPHNPQVPPPLPQALSPGKVVPEKFPERDRKDRAERRASRHEEKTARKHMTEAEKSILHLRKREKMQREKWEKYRKDQPPNDSLDDDFAKNIEKTLATILSKKEKLTQSGDDKDEKEEEKEKKGRKRKKHKDRQKNKMRRAESPKSEEIDENEMLNMRGGSPMHLDETRERERSLSGNSMNSMSSDEYSSDKSKGEDKPRKREKRNNRKNRERNKHRDRERNNRGEMQLKDSQGVCVFYLQGKCQKNNCPYSHEASPPMKLELCKFYLMDCCAKGDKCSYMHSDFPCKFYHTGLQCSQGENCKFAHGKPLSEDLKQILFKHIETAPRDILGGFPRMSREEALNKINVTQNHLHTEYGVPLPSGDAGGGIPSLFDIDVPVPPELMQSGGGEGDGGKGQDKGEKARNRRSRWQDADDQKVPFGIKPFAFGQDQDMRINSNGDIDMRTLPPNLSAPPPSIVKKSADFSAPIDLEQYKREAGILPTVPNNNTVDFNKDVDIRSTQMMSFNSQDVDIRQQNVDPRMLASKDVDIRQLLPVFDDKKASQDCPSEEESNLQIDTGEDYTSKEPEVSIPDSMPKAQRELFMRIQAQQKNIESMPNNENFEADENINWYSDDESDDENRLTIKVDNDDVKEKEEPPKVDFASIGILSPSKIKPQDVVDKLGDLSKIDISAEVTKLLTSMSQARGALPQATKEPEKPVTPSRDPRNAASELKSSPVAESKELKDPRTAGDARTASNDPRLLTDPRQRSRQSSTENQRPEKISIYEQGSISLKSAEGDSDSRLGDTDGRGSTRSDVDLRNLSLPFKAMQNYTPATEIDASINSHPGISWKVYIVDVPRPDYAGLKLSISDAEKSGDPRLRKIFRLSTEEKDSPMSPKESTNKIARIDPRLRKQEESKSVDQMNFNQQLNMLQASVFYQSLTSNQKVLLNQELASRNDQNLHDPVLNSILSNLNLIPNTNIQSNPSIGAALAILANITKLNPILSQQNPGMLGSQNPILSQQNPNIIGQIPPNMNQPGLLGAAPGIPNLPPDFPINFDPRNGGLLGNAPPQFGNNFPPDSMGNFPPNFNDDFYPHDNYMGDGNRHNSNRGFNRDRRRGRNNFNRNSRNFRNNRNRSNRSHTPP